MPQCVDRQEQMHPQINAFLSTHSEQNGGTRSYEGVTTFYFMYLTYIFQYIKPCWLQAIFLSSMLLLSDSVVVPFAEGRPAPTECRVAPTSSLNTAHLSYSALFFNSSSINHATSA
jgi:hypothetical protein